MCSRQNSLGKGGLNAKAKRREFIECDIRKSHTKGYIGFLSFNDNEGNSKKLKS